MPTKDCRHLIEPDIAVLQQWLPEVGELIIVDSHSKDGTLELLKESFPYAHTQIITRPPGLYAAWNHGIQLAKKPWTYISTAGDTMGHEDIKYLLSIVVQNDVDVVVSPPNFRNKAWEPITGPKWPAHAIFDTRENLETLTLAGADLVAFALKHARPPTYTNWLCSSASNIYRTSYLQANPFPEDAGHGGDTLFGIRNARHMRATFCRRSRGTFLLHDAFNFSTLLSHDEIFEIYYLGAYLHELSWLIDQMSPGCSTFFKELILDPAPARSHVTMFDAAGKLGAHNGDFSIILTRIEQLHENVGRLKTANRELKEKIKVLKTAQKQAKLSIDNIYRRIPKWLRKWYGLHRNDSPDLAV